MSMSSDGIRKATLGWQISPTGGMTNNAGGIVEINEVAPVPSGSIAIDSGAIIVDEPPPLPAPRADMETRSRKNTIERFNDEMAVLDRPLEGEVEYIDEKPPRRWGHFVAFAATIAIVGGGGAYLLSHPRAAIAAARPSAGLVGGGVPIAERRSPAAGSRAGHDRAGGRGEAQGSTRHARREYIGARSADERAGFGAESPDAQAYETHARFIGHGGSRRMRR